MVAACGRRAMARAAMAAPISAAMHHNRPWSATGLSSASLLQANAAAAVLARRAFVDQLDAEALQRRNELHQRLDVAAHHAVARFHALDRGQGKARRLGEGALVDAGEGAGGAQLARGNHEKR